ncbi:MAG: Response regulator [Dehalococcoidia bacterium]|nr:Response regulator [Dehalococcoidia bacterium]
MANLEERILIVDDEGAITRLLRQKLSRKGYGCEEANSAEQALARLRSNPTELVILDVMMPGKSGIDLLPEIKSGWPDTAVIMATAVAETSIAIESMKRGADDYIIKPFDLDEVALSVGRALEKRRLQLEIKEYQHHLEEKVGQQTAEIRKLFLGAIEALVFALEAKDKYTGGHSRRATEIALAIGSELGLSTDDMEDLRWGSLLHDVGKIAVDQLIQNKPGRLTHEEYAHIMIHAHIGAGIVKPVVNERVVEMIEHHHDHFDGSGLHQAIAGKDIPLGARILAVADAFDAMVSDRPYRSAMSLEEALAEIGRCTGTQFDPVVASAFIKTKETGKILVSTET